jgi:heat-inducible transcriptional repressor
MAALNAIPVKKSAKQERERQVLLGLIHFYLQTGKPVGSHTLQEAGFEHLSSATIRNYFANLEKEGFLEQQHSSGGRIPTNLAYRFYAQEYSDPIAILQEHETALNDLRHVETREISTFLQQAAEKLGDLSQMAVFLSAPRFDQDFVVNLKIMSIDHSRCLCAIITDFGDVRTEIIHVDQKLSAFVIKRIESYFNWRLTGHDKPENFSREEEDLAQKIYNELMVRYLVGYTNFVDSDLYRTGFSKLLNYPGFYESNALADSLALFENAQHMRLLVRECCKLNRLKFWIGDDLAAYSQTVPDCAVLAIPYYINKHVAGAVGLLGPIRMPYRELFSQLSCFSQNISEALGKSLYKYKITFRQPHQGVRALPAQRQLTLLGKQ